MGCKLCEGVFYNKKAWDSHNLSHSPSDLYIHSEDDRKLAVTRVDQDFDYSRVPTTMDKLLQVKKKAKVNREVVTVNEKETGGKKKGKNRAVVDSDSEDDKSDTSIEGDEEEETMGKQTKEPKKKKMKVEIRVQRLK